MKKIIALGVVIFVLAAGYTVAWFWAAAQASAYVKTLETADGTSMPRVVCQSLGIGGFPFGFDATCTNATIESGDVTVTVSGIKASAEVYRPTHVLVFAQSPATIDDAFTGSRSRLDFASAQASVRLDGWRLGRASLVVTEPVWNDAVLDDRLIAKASKIEAHVRDVPAKHDAGKGLATLEQYVLVEGLDAPGFEIGGGKSTFEAEISNLPDDIRTYGDADLLKRWQSAGGKYAIVGFKGDDATSSFDATGTLGLDTGGRLEGQLKLHSRGVVERLGPVIPEQYRGWIVGTPADDGSYSQVLNIAAGVVFSGLVPTGIIPPVW
jgi:hypothetical protein